MTCHKSTFDFNCKGLKFHLMSRQDDKTKHITLTRKGNYVCWDSWLRWPRLNALSISISSGSVSNAVIRPLSLQDQQSRALQKAKESEKFVVAIYSICILAFLKILSRLYYLVSGKQWPHDYCFTQYID